MIISEASGLNSQSQLLCNQRGVHNVLINTNAASPVVSFQADYPGGSVTSVSRWH